MAIEANSARVFGPASAGGHVFRTTIFAPGRFVSTDFAETSFVDGKPIPGNRVIVEDGVNYVDVSVLSEALGDSVESGDAGVKILHFSAAMRLQRARIGREAVFRKISKRRNRDRRQNRKPASRGAETREDCNRFSLRRHRQKAVVRDRACADGCRYGCLLCFGLLEQLPRHLELPANARRSG